MRFAKIVFWSAGVWGVLVLMPLFFLFDFVGTQDPPALTHAEFYFGFTALALVWQFAFFVIGCDPLRFRPMMIAAVLEKASYVVTLSVLALQGRVLLPELMTGVPDAILGTLFVIAFVRTGSAGNQA